ncbi:hypothetical protein [Dyella nitratireducens]|uniref:hypothetical protein n=1 Tax=Dyella nitratireducens TaxID=1849580 RepID=UPI001663421E|nr:hypothetical protein [Dyella nitratireducens]GLQ42152.1 hypothetical protein GCM10007902_20020 [Dyella nitratireducens]
MSMSPYDFDTRFAPFEAFASETPFAPFALWGWFTAPALWWTDACLNACGVFSEAMLSAMTCPYRLPANQDEKSADVTSVHTASA